VGGNFFFSFSQRLQNLGNCNNLKNVFITHKYILIFLRDNKMKTMFEWLVTFDSVPQQMVEECVCHFEVASPKHYLFLASTKMLMYCSLSLYLSRCKNMNCIFAYMWVQIPPESICIFFLKKIYTMWNHS
jgi:hypothetical protein